MGTIIHDLDILRPEKQTVKLGGKEIDISFIPSGIALKIIQQKQSLEKAVGSKDQIKKIKNNDQAAVDTFNLIAELCATITQYQYPEMDKEWLLSHTDMKQLKILIDLVVASVYKSLEGIKLDEEEEEELKNSQEAIKK